MSSQTAKYSGPRGYLKITLSVVSKDAQAKLPLANPNINDEIEGNLLLPDGLTLERQRALFVFKIYKGDSISRKKTRVLENLKKPDKSSLPNSLVQITFAGITVTTSVQKNTQNPVWNEQITIAELFPPLCQRVKIQLKTKSASKCGRLDAVKYLSLHSIANDQEKGFLPTFGPAYVHFYKKDFFGDIYVGKVLIALHTQLQHEYLTKPKSFVRKSILPINENTLWKLEPIVLFCAVLNVNAIDKRFSRRPIRFEMSIGPPRLLTTGDGIYAPNITEDILPVTVDRRYYFLNFEGKYPCIHFQCHFPDIRRRFYNKNMIEKIAMDLKARLDDIEPLFLYEKGKVSSLVVERKLLEALDILAVQCRKYIDIVGPNVSQAVTDLDREKASLCMREMEDIEKIAKTIYNHKTKKKSYKRAQKLYTRISLLVDHPQDCWPDILMFLVYGDKKIATRRIESENVVFSMVDEEIGINCGKIQSICFDTPLKLRSVRRMNAVCKMDIFMWIGLRRHMEFCINALPECYKFANSIDDPSIPKHLILNDKFDFQCRAHIYQGKFTFATDKTGLSDFYVRVILNEESATTAVVKGKLNPLWNETVIIPSVTIYGTREYVKSFPPTCIIEVLDYDDIIRSDYIGRVFVKPVVKLRDEAYTKPDFPPMLKWHSIISKQLEVGRVLLCIELMELTSESIEKPNKGSITEIPDDIKPVLSSYKVDVLFWGVRHLKKLHRIPVHKPKITVDFTVAMVESESTTLKLLNFNETNQQSLIRLPVEKDYVPSLAIHLHDHRSFGRQVYVANHITQLDRFLHFPLSREERDFLLTHQQKKSFDSFESQESIILVKPQEPMQTEPTMKDRFEDAKEDVKYKIKKKKKPSCNCCACFTCCPCCPCYKKKKKKQKKSPVAVKSKETSAIVDILPDKEDDSFTDWWTKYYLSIEKPPDWSSTTDTTVSPSQSKFRLKVFEEELEHIQEFSYLQDTIASFQLIRGETTEDDDVNQKHVMGVFKGNVKIYPWPPPKDVDYVTSVGRSLTNGFFQNAPNNDQLCFIARVYCVKGIKIRPKDLSGKVDPFLVASMGNQHFGDSKTYIPRQINPTFGKMFEFQGTFPTDTLVKVQVWDYDRNSRHDLIGETTIDLENRFYTKHRAHCGLPYEYTEIGATPWRDVQPPTEILDELCKTKNIPFPKYFDTYIMIGPLMFSYSVPEGEKPKTAYTKEELSLDLLHKWQELPVVGCHLVPEHVETRSLYNPHQPGLEQGKLQLWVDIFPTKDLPPPPAVDISPRKPERFELRVIIWNTEDVLLKEDDFFLGEKKSDIYVKGWLIGLEETQSTDVHYRSLNGEGNFNWRFVFPFTYLKTENKVVVKKKERFQMVESEKKFPCKLKLQVWDNDTFSADDFLGSLTMELASMPRGAKSPQKCNLKLLNPSAPTINLFRIKRTRGWWPFQVLDEETKEYIIAGKLEAEFHIASGDEADVSPVGKGRNDPNALPKPKISKSVRIRNTYSSVVSSTLEHISSIKTMVVESSSRFFRSRSK